MVPVRKEIFRSALILRLVDSHRKTPSSFTLRGQLAADSHRLACALAMTLTGNQLKNHQQTFCLEQLEAKIYIVTPLLVLTIAALAGHLEATAGPSELFE